MRKELRDKIQKQKLCGKNKITPDVTTKHGKLKIDRKSELTKMYVDDLATLDTLTEVSFLFISRDLDIIRILLVQICLL